MAAFPEAMQKKPRKDTLKTSWTESEREGGETRLHQLCDFAKLMHARVTHCVVPVFMYLPRTCILLTLFSIWYFSQGEIKKNSKLVHYGVEYSGLHKLFLQKSSEYL